MIVPKDWKSFQHYKERRPAWIKLHRTLLDNADFQRLPVASRALAPMLWLLAAEYENGEITACTEDIAWRLRMTLAEFDRAVTPLFDSGFFLSSSPASAMLAQCKHDASPETEGETEKRENTAAAPRVSSRFDEFWKEYPKREGDNPRAPAEKKFNALVKTGIDPEVIIAGARQASADARSRGVYATKFVPQAQTWLNQQRFMDCAAQAGEAEQLDWESVLSSYKKTGHWSRWAGPDPESPACKAPPDLLEKYGISSPQIILHNFRN